jgi:sugar phosphate isomerase/epimerase
MTPVYKDEIYLGTVLIETKRWGKDRASSLLVSEWSQRIADAGFDGIELWQWHALQATDEERFALKEGPMPVSIFNAYDSCENETADVRRECAELVRFFGSAGMKYNLGKEPERHEEYCVNLEAWREMLPESFRLLCECHGGSTMNDPAVARETLDRLDLPGGEVIVHGFNDDEEDLRNRFELLGNRITHVHANLSYKWSLTADQVRERVELLRKLGFQGSFTLEFTEGTRAEGENAEMLFRNAVRDLEVLRDCLEES